MNTILSAKNDYPSGGEMRILLATRFAVPVGGVEEYLARIDPVLRARGHELAFIIEHDWPGVPFIGGKKNVWIVDRDGESRTFTNAHDFRPDVVYSNGLDSASLDERVAAIAPGAYSAHGYFGTCISGRKMHAFPAFAVCGKKFGAACLAHYLPRRCGGLNPLTMLRSYRGEAARLAAITRYSALVVHSKHMAREYERHGLVSTLVRLPPPPAPKNGARTASNDDEKRLLFLGRLTDVKGVGISIDAVIEAARHLSRVSITYAGDGNEREAAERHARAVAPAAPNATFRFVGQVDAARRDELLRDTHALLMPSVWPEPFGMVGLEAASFGIPAIAFKVGGVPEWLADGVGGVLAEPPLASSLARAIVACVADAERRAALGRGARATFERYSLSESVDAIEGVFRRIVDARSS